MKPAVDEYYAAGQYLLLCYDAILHFILFVIFIFLSASRYDIVPLHHVVFLFKTKQQLINQQKNTDYKKFICSKVYRIPHILQFAFLSTRSAHLFLSH